MNLSILKKTIPAVLLATVCASALSAGAMTASAAETITEFDFATGLPEPTAEDIAREHELYADSTVVAAKHNSKAPKARAAAAVPSAVDLSAQPNFPMIGNQNQMGACACFGATYYQYTYEYYKNADVDLKNPANEDMIFSPAFTWNFLNLGTNSGAHFYDAVEIEKNQGALTLGDMPFDNRANYYDYSWSDNTEAMRAALSRRVVDSGKYLVPTADAQQYLDEVKAALYGSDGTDGHVLIFATHMYSWDINLDGYNPATDRNEYICRGVYKIDYYDSYGYLRHDFYGGHCMTVVGYDDNIWVDLNGNGERDYGEMGAFKVANSWDSDWGNDGYVWLSYDALNAVSAVSGWDTKDPSEREAALAWYDWDNGLYWAAVDDVKSYYVGEVDLQTNYRNSVSIYAANSAAEYDSPTMYARKLKDSYDLYWDSYSRNQVLTQDGPFIFAYDALSDEITEHLDGYKWYVDIDGTITSASFKITDNKGNVVKDFGSVGTDAVGEAISLQMGDLNYDNLLNADDNTIHEAGDFSDLQAVLDQDYNYDDHDGNNNHGDDDELLPNGEVECDYIVNGDSVTVRVWNVGETELRNWALRVDNFFGTPYDFWNATLDGDVIYSVDFNSVIPVGGYVTFGYKLADMTNGAPTFTLCSAVIDVTDYVDVEIECIGDYGSSAQYKITIRNNDEEDIIGWSITFTTDGLVINAVWGDANTFTETDGVYTLNCSEFNGSNVIEAGGTVEIYFNATKDGEVDINNIHVNAITEIETIND